MSGATGGGPGPRGGPSPRDPALQPERTRLAWRRTALTATVVALLAARLALQEPGIALRAVALPVIFLGWLAMLLVGGRRIAAMAAARPVPAGRAVPLTTLAMLGFAVLGVVLVAGR